MPGQSHAGVGRGGSASGPDGTGSTEAALGLRAAELWRQGDLDGADALFLEQWRVSLAAGSEAGLAGAFDGLVALRRSRGDVDGIIILCEARRDAGSSAAGSAGTLVFMAELAAELAAERSTGASLRLLEAAERMARDGREYRTAGALLGQRVRVLAGAGDLREALELTERRLELARSEGLAEIEVDALRARAHLLLRQADVGGAVEAQAKAEATAREVGAKEQLAEALADRREAAVSEPGAFALSDPERAEAMHLALEFDRPDLTARLLWPDTPASPLSLEKAVERAAAEVPADSLRRNRDFTFEQKKHRLALFFSDALLARPDAEPQFEDWFIKGVCHVELDEGEEAVAAYREALALDDQDARAHASLAVALLGLGRVDDALSAARAALALDPDMGLFWYDLARGFLSLAAADPSLESRGINALRVGLERAPQYAERRVPDPGSGEEVPAKELAARRESVPTTTAEAVLAP